MIKKCGGFFLVISFAVCVSQDQQERSIQATTYLDRVHKFIRPYINYLLGRSTARERKMLKSKAKRDAVVAASSAVAVGGVAVGIKMASPTLRQKISKWIHKEKSTQKESEKQEMEIVQQSTESSSVASKSITKDETVPENKKNYEAPKRKAAELHNITCMAKSKESHHAKYKIENNRIHVISEAGEIFFIFEQPSTVVLKSNCSILLQDINKELIKIICDLAKIKIKSRVFIPIEEPFNERDKFTKESRENGNFLEYYEQASPEWTEFFSIHNKAGDIIRKQEQKFTQAITPWDWTQEFYNNKKKKNF